MSFEISLIGRIAVLIETIRCISKPVIMDNFYNAYKVVLQI